MTSIYVLIAVVVLFVGYNLYMSRGIKGISTTELKDLIAQKTPDYMYIDVRTPGEFNNRKIKGFRNMPLNQLGSMMNQLPKEKKIVVICQSGSRSTAACRQLTKAGYTDIINVKGGMSMWRD